MPITILAFYDRISAFHSLKPFLVSRHRKAFTFTNSAGYCLKRDRNRVLFMDRWFLKPDRVDLELMKRLREKYHTIFFFNGNAGGGIPRLEVLPYVDLLFNKSLFTDRSLYDESFYGDELFTDHYHRVHGVDDPEPRRRATLSDVVGTDPEAISAAKKKLRVSWNIGIGDFPKVKTRQRIAVALARTVGMPAVRPFYHNVGRPAALPDNRGLFPVHARWGGPKRPTLLVHRTIIEDKIRDDDRFLLGRVDQRQFNTEIRNSKITLSPFGWGEICFRDFEAVLNASLLLKPDVSHLETWPDIFVPHTTYVPIGWDGDNVVEQSERYLTDEAARRTIVQNAFETYHDQARHIEERLEEILNLVPADA